MGWASGSSLFSEVISGCKKTKIDFKDRKVFYKILIEAMEDEDWDTQDECLGEDEAYDEALLEIHPDWNEE